MSVKRTRLREPLPPDDSAKTNGDSEQTDTKSDNPDNSGPITKKDKTDDSDTEPMTPPTKRERSSKRKNESSEKKRSKKKPAGKSARRKTKKSISQSGYTYLALATRTVPSTHCSTSNQWSYHKTEGEARKCLDQMYWQFLSDIKLPLDVTQEKLDLHHYSKSRMNMPPFGGVLQRVWVETSKATDLPWSIPSTDLSKQEQIRRDTKS